MLSRLGSIILAVLTLWYGLALGEERPFNYQAGYYNIPPIRLAILGGILILQVYVSTLFQKARQMSPTITQKTSHTTTNNVGSAHYVFTGVCHVIKK